MFTLLTRRVLTIPGGVDIVQEIGTDAGSRAYRLSRSDAPRVRIVGVLSARGRPRTARLEWLSDDSGWVDWEQNPAATSVWLAYARAVPWGG